MVPPGAASLDEAHAAIELWEHYSGKVLDPAQRLTVEVMMAQDADGRWAAATTGREMPRQNGKGDEVEVVELWGLVQRAEAILHTVHDAVLLASQAQQRMLAVLERPDLRRLKKREWLGTGQQMIEMRNGGTIWYRTRTGGGGRGVDDIDRLVVDEAQHATEEHLAAVSPTLLANANPQLNALGTAGIEGKSAWWWSVRRRALGENPGGFGYVGHTAETIRMDDQGRVVQDPVDVNDRNLWGVANPALKSNRGQGIGFLEEQLLRLGPASFAREHMGVWDPEPSNGAGVIDPETWVSLGQFTEIDSQRQWALAVSRDRRWAALGVAGLRADGLAHVEWLDHRTGTGWVVDRCVEAWQAKRIPLRVHKDGAEGSLIEELEAKGVEVVAVSTADVAKATGMFLDAVANRSMRHLGQPSLDRAVRAAHLRTTTSGASTWDDTTTVDLTTLKAVTVALGGVPKPNRAPRIHVLKGAE